MDYIKTFEEFINEQLINENTESTADSLNVAKKYNMQVDQIYIATEYVSDPIQGVWGFSKGDVIWTDGKYSAIIKIRGNYRQVKIDGVFSDSVKPKAMKVLRPFDSSTDKKVAKMLTQIGIGELGNNYYSMEIYINKGMKVIDAVKKSLETERYHKTVNANTPKQGLKKLGYEKASGVEYIDTTEGEIMVIGNYLDSPIIVSSNPLTGYKPATLSRAIIKANDNRLKWGAKKIISPWSY